MNPPSSPSRKLPRWLTNPAIAVPVAVFGSIALLVVIQLAINLWPQPYELRATPAYEESCLGGDEHVTELFGEGVEEHRDPHFNGTEPPTSYSCEFRWDTSETLSVTIVVDSNGHSGYEETIDMLKDYDGVRVIDDHLDGFDDAYCTSFTSPNGKSDYECNGAIGNMEVLVSTASDGDGEAFGPGDVSIQKVTRVFGALAEEHFKAR